MKKLYIQILNNRTGAPIPSVQVTLLPGKIAATPTKQKSAIYSSNAQAVIGRLQTNQDGVVAFSNPSINRLCKSGVTVTVFAPQAKDKPSISRHIENIDWDNLTSLSVDMDETQFLTDTATAVPALPYTDGGLTLEDVLYSPSIIQNFDELHFGDDACARMVPNDQTIRRFQTQEIFLTERDHMVCAENEKEMRIHKGEMLHYDVEWSRLGYSYGDLIYSLALTPGEHVNLTVSTWEQRQFAQSTRTNETRESATSGYSRANALSESMDGLSTQFGIGAAISAGRSSGSSQSIGGGASASVPFKAIQIGAKLAASIKKATSTFVGGTLTANYNRNKIALNSARNFTENIQQSADRWRRDHQTIVAEQTINQEQSTSSRSVCNRNYCRVLNVFYHEVLENHRVTTSLSGSEDVLFIPHKVSEFNAQRAWCSKPLLQAFLLEPNLVNCYAGLSRTLFGASESEDEAGGGSNELTSTKFKIALNIGNNGFAQNNSFSMVYYFKDGTKGQKPISRSNRWKKNSSYTHEVTVNGFDPTQLQYVGLKNTSSVWDVTIDSYTIYFLHPSDGWVSLASGSPGKMKDGSEVKENCSYTSPVAQEEEALPISTDTAGPTPEDDAACAEMLVAHLNCHKHYYNALLWLLEDRNARISRFEDIVCGSNIPLSDQLDPTPLGLYGDYVVFAMSGGTFAPADPVEVLDDRLVVLPTSGVFADAALGQCTTCEPLPEDENDPFWKIVDKPNKCDCDSGTLPSFANMSGLLANNSLAFPSLSANGAAGFATFLTPPTTDATNSLVTTFGGKFAEALFGENTEADLEGLNKMLEKLQGTVSSALSADDPEAPDAPTDPAPSGGGTGDNSTPTDGGG